MGTVAIHPAEDSHAAVIAELVTQLGYPTSVAARVIVLSSGNHRSGAHLFYEAQGYAFTGRRYRKSP